MRIKLSTMLDAPAERVWAEVKKPRLLLHVAAPLLCFKPVDPPELPEEWREREHLVSMRLFGVVPLGRQWVVTSLSSPADGCHAVRDNGRGRLARVWEHRITIERVSADRCRYTDDVEVEAGPLTPLVWAFAQIFYRHRQRRWRRLVASNFVY